MAGTFSKIHIHVVFAVKHREALIQKSWKDELHKYMAGIIQAKNQKSLIINGMPDHIHALIGLRPSLSISDLVRDVKNNSANFINSAGFLHEHKFAWQEGFGAFSHSASEIGRLYSYIENQEQHHAKKTFRMEYEDLLNECGIDYEPQFLFDWVEAEPHVTPSGIRAVDDGR